MKKDGCCGGKMGAKASTASSGKVIMSKVDGNKDKSPMKTGWPRSKGKK